MQIEKEKQQKKIQRSDYNQDQLMRYFYFRGQIYLQLENYEKAYFSFCKALSFTGSQPKVNLAQNTPDTAQDCYNKVVLLKMLVNQFNGFSNLEHNQCPRSLVEYPFMLPNANNYMNQRT